VNILFITHPYPNYVPDLLLHGLRKLLGNSVVDFPRKDCVYDGVLGLGVCPDDQKSYGWFPEDNDIDRNDVQTKLTNGFFSYIVLDIRSIETALCLLSQAKYKGLAIIDGEDNPIAMKPGEFLFFQRETDGTNCSIPLPMAMPEEIFMDINQFDNEAKKYSVGFIGSLSDQQGFRERVVADLIKYFPDGLFKLSGVASDDNQNPDGRLGKKDYYKNLQQCETLVTLRGAGFDTFRYWEHAACNAVNVVEEFPLFIPDRFEDNVHQLSFSSEKSLIMNIETMIKDKDRALEIRQAGRKHLMHSHLTIHRAKYFLDKMKAVYA